MFSSLGNDVMHRPRKAAIYWAGRKLVGAMVWLFIVQVFRHLSFQIGKDPSRCGR